MVSKLPFPWRWLHFQYIYFFYKTYLLPPKSNARDMKLIKIKPSPTQTYQTFSRGADKGKPPTPSWFFQTFSRGKTDKGNPPPPSWFFLPIKERVFNYYSIPQRERVQCERLQPLRTMKSLNSKLEQEITVSYVERVIFNPWSLEKLP